MESITGLVGREEFLDQVIKETKKGKHVLLTGPVGVGKSAVLKGVIDKLNHTVIHLTDHQTKGQFVELARQLLAAGILAPKSLDLAERFHDMEPSEIPWAKIRRQVNRLSIRDLTAAIIPALADAPEEIIIAVDDMTFLTPTQQAFWLQIFEHSQVIACASEKKRGVRKLWWRMKEIEVPALSAANATQLVRSYITRKGVLVESPELYISHVVKQSGGIPQAICDMLDESAKERIVDKRKVRQMRHESGVKYFDFTPVMLVSGAAIIGMRYVAIGLGDTSLYVMAGMGAALFLSLRFFMFRGMGH